MLTMPIKCFNIVLSLDGDKKGEPMKRYLILNEMERKGMSRKDVAEASNGFLSYDMVVKQLNKKDVIVSENHIKGYIKALNLSNDLVIDIFFS